MLLHSAWVTIMSRQEGRAICYVDAFSCCIWCLCTCCEVTLEHVSLLNFGRKSNFCSMHSSVIMLASSPAGIFTSRICTNWPSRPDYQADNDDHGAAATGGTINNTHAKAYILAVQSTSGICPKSLMCFAWSSLMET